MRAHSIASVTRIPDGCGRVHNSRFSGRLSSLTGLGGETLGYRLRVRESEWVRFVIPFEVLDRDRSREMAREMAALGREEPGTVVDAFGSAEGLPRSDALGAPTTWRGAPIAAVTDAR